MKKTSWMPQSLETIKVKFKNIENLLLERFRIGRKDIENLLLAGGLLLTTDWLAKLIMPPWKSLIGTIVITVILFSLWVFLLSAVYLRARDSLPHRTLRVDDTEGVKCLILTLSLPNRTVPDKATVPFSYTTGKGKDARLVVLKGESLEEDMQIIDEEGPGFNWQQLLRAIKPHLKTAEKVILIGSQGINGEKGSADYLPQAVSFIKPHFSRETEFIRFNPAVDFENFEALTRAYEQAVDSLVGCTCAEGKPYRQMDVVLDATGGFKTASIAAAMITLAGSVRFQYVPTVGQLVPKTYDLEFHFPHKIT